MLLAIAEGAYQSADGKFRLRYVGDRWSAYEVMPRQGVRFLGDFESLEEAAMECHAVAPVSGWPSNIPEQSLARAHACVSTPAGASCAESGLSQTPTQLETPT